MKKARLVFLGLLAMTFILQLNLVSALIVYQTNQDITPQVGGSKYWASRQTSGSGDAPPTKIQHKQDVTGPIFYNPGKTSQATYSIATVPQGYGWATDFNLNGDIPAGQWNFRVSTKNNRDENGPGYVGINAFKYCSGANTRLFYIQSNTDALASTDIITQVISTSQPAFQANGCRLKFEYWLTIPSNVEEDNSNNLLDVNTDDFYVEFPYQGGTGCQDSDGDGFQASGCGGNDCNDDNPAINPGAAESCNSIDDDCDGQTDEGLQQSQSCGIGYCRRNVTQSCVSGAYTPQCVPASPVVEICSNSIDENCNGIIDDGANCTLSCTPGQNRTCNSNTGACGLGVQLCTQEGIWGSCINGNGTSEELCNGIDDNCNNMTDEGLQQTINCGVGVCKNIINQSCNNGTYAPACIPRAPQQELCNDIDDDCDSRIDEDIFEFCGLNAGECRQGKKTCANGMFGACQGEAAPKNETCDLLDNDCDGKVDEDGICIQDVAPLCSEDWICDEWDSCINKDRSTRQCRDKNNCGTILYKPSTERLCTLGNKTTAFFSNESAESVSKDSILTASLAGSIVALLAIGWFVSVERRKKTNIPNESKNGENTKEQDKKP